MKTVIAFTFMMPLLYAQSTSVTFDSGNLSPQTNPSCYGLSRQFSQNAQYNWTLWCIDVSGNFTAIRSGALATIQGNGACPDLAFSACNYPYGLSGSPAPQFTPNRSLDQVTQTWSISATAGSASLQPGFIPGTSSCGSTYSGQTPTTLTSNPSRCYCNPGDPSCKSTSPILIDTTGEGFFMTSYANGVQFRRGPASPLEQFSWTDPAHHNAWLVRPNTDGSVTSMSMNMFGNLSPQPASTSANGYAALAYWADQEGCGEIKKLDAKACPAVWGALRLWHDANQNGIADAGELQTLQDAGITGISLDYHEDRYIDAYGNMFEYRAQDWNVLADGNNRCYDVFLVHQ